MITSYCDQHNSPFMTRPGFAHGPSSPRYTGYTHVGGGGNFMTAILRQKHPALRRDGHSRVLSFLASFAELIRKTDDRLTERMGGCRVAR